MKRTFKYILCATAALLAATTPASADTQQGRDNKAPRLWGCLNSSNTWNSDGSDYGLYRINIQPAISIVSVIPEAEA